MQAKGDKKGSCKLKFISNTKMPNPKIGHIE